MHNVHKYIIFNKYNIYCNKLIFQFIYHNNEKETYDETTENIDACISYIVIMRR